MPTKPKTEEVVEEPKDKNEASLTEMLRRVMLATIGAVAIAQEELEALVNRLVERGEIAEQDGKKLITEMKEKRKSKTSKVEDEVSKNLEGVLKRMNIPSKADVDALSQKISTLSKKIDDLKKAE
jgi:poly(hydroxyalkanoate) granule-associated protein